MSVHWGGRGPGHLCRNSGPAVAATPITVGSLTTDGNMALGGDTNQGTAFQASASGTVNYLTILGSSAASSSVNYRLVIYAATSATVISGAKLGETAVQSSLGVSETKKVALLAPVTITSGQWYYLSVLPSGSMSCAKNTANAGRFFGDTYSDGAVDPAPASSSNGTAAPSMTATTT